MGVLCTDSFTAPFGLGRGEGVGSAIEVALSAFVNNGIKRNAARKRSRRDGNEGMRGEKERRATGTKETGTGGEKIQANGPPWRRQCP